MHVIRKDAEITNTGADDDFPGSFEVILSAPTLDRDGDTLQPEDWEQPLPEHITFDQDHAMTVAGTVGSGAPRIDPDTGNLIVSGTYSSLQRAQDVRTLVKEGHIKTTSVAFMSKKVAKAGGDGYRVVRELLNGAFVAIPSNREALVLSSKGAKAGARNNKADADMIQTVHDHSVSLGADCDAAGDAKALRLGLTGKALAGSLEAAQEAMRNALAAAYPGQWAWIRGTVPDGESGGYVVFELEDPETFETQTFQQSFSVDGDAVTLVGDPAAVNIQEVISGQADAGSAAAADAAGTEPAAADAAAGKGKAAEDAESPTQEEEALQLAVRARAYAALNRLSIS